jgi:hypothetical protein
MAALASNSQSIYNLTTVSMIKDGTADKPRTSFRPTFHSAASSRRRAAARSKSRSAVAEAEKEEMRKQPRVKMRTKPPIPHFPKKTMISNRRRNYNEDADEWEVAPLSDQGSFDDVDGDTCNNPSNSEPQEGGDNVTKKDGNEENALNSSQIKARSQRLGRLESRGVTNQGNGLTAKTRVNFLQLNKENLWKKASLNATEREKAAFDRRKQRLVRKPGYVPQFILRAKQECAAAAEAREQARCAREASKSETRTTALPEPERRTLLQGLLQKQEEKEFEYQKHTHIRGNLGARCAAYVQRLENELDDLELMIKKLSSPVVLVVPAGEQ